MSNYTLLAILINENRVMIVSERDQTFESDLLFGLGLSGGGGETSSCASSCIRGPSFAASSILTRQSSTVSLPHGGHLSDATREWQILLTQAGGKPQIWDHLQHATGTRMRPAPPKLLSMVLLPGHRFISLLAFARPF
jgi:hypothetical protein